MLPLRIPWWKVLLRAVMLWFGILVAAMVLLAIDWYFYLPALIFGSRLFDFGIGVGPKGYEGYVVTAVFYYILSVAVVLLSELFLALLSGRKGEGT